jgi:hypothetical protein
MVAAILVGHVLDQLVLAPIEASRKFCRAAFLRTRVVRVAVSFQFREAMAV